MDNLELARAIINSEYESGVMELTQVSDRDRGEIVLLKLWVRYWFLAEDEEVIKDLAARSLALIMERKRK